MAGVDGSCLCGAVHWRYTAKFARVTHCHCAMCRKAHAAPFATYAMGPADGLVIDGDENRVRFESSPGFIRSFCRHCGSVLPNIDLGEWVAVPVGGLDVHPGPAPGAHIFFRWKAPWHNITDDLPRHDNYPDEPEPAVTRTAPPLSTDGTTRGSCLCGAVSFSVNDAFAAVYNCHCSRCRKARAAAYTTNAVTSLDKFLYTRGTDQLKTYRPPDAEHFAQVFCTTCGAGMPVENHTRRVAIVPFGALDDDPGCGATFHKFVGSRCDWYPITDTLPQFEAEPPA